MIRVLVLTREQCHWCDEAKTILIRLATTYNLSIETLDITTLLKVKRWLCGVACSFLLEFSWMEPPFPMDGSQSANSVES